jgi:hypothetical protein
MCAAKSDLGFDLSVLLSTSSALFTAQKVTTPVIIHIIIAATAHLPPVSNLQLPIAENRFVRDEYQALQQAITNA